MGSRLVFTAAILWFGWADPAEGQTHVLYDGSLGDGRQTPSDQGFIYAYAPLIGNQAAQTAAGGLALLDTMPHLSDQAGYFSYFPFLGSHPNMPAVLDRTGGFKVEFSLRLLSEEHNPRDDNGDGIDDRGGLSLMVISNDLRGIELAFWPQQVWAYDDDSAAANNLFTHAEGTSGFNPSLTVTDYSLQILGDEYQLLAGGETVLNGLLRSYTSAVVPVFNPYTRPNFLFLGDDTTSAGSMFQIGRIAVTVPEPGTVGLLVTAGTLARRRSRRAPQ